MVLNLCRCLLLLPLLVWIQVSISHTIFELTLHAFNASMNGVSDNDVQILCRWKSSSYNTYIRIPKLIVFLIWSNVKCL